MVAETDEVKKGLNSLIYALSITMMVIIGSWIFGIPEYFGTLVSTMGFLLLFLMIYSIR